MVKVTNGRYALIPCIKNKIDSIVPFSMSIYFNCKYNSDDWEITIIKVNGDKICEYKEIQEFDEKAKKVPRKFK